MADQIPEKLQLKLYTPEKKIIEAEVHEVIAPGIEGEFGVLPGHIPFITALKIGELTFRTGQKVERLAVAWGYAEVLPEQVTILAETAELASQIDVERAIRAKERAEAQLRKLSLEDKEHTQALAALQRAINRIQVASKGR